MSNGMMAALICLTVAAPVAVVVIATLVERFLDRRWRDTEGETP